MDKKAIILLSGGLDSATTLFLAKNRGFSLNALVFDYGQKHKKEVKFAEKLAKLTKTEYTIIKVRLPWSRSSLTGSAESFPKRLSKSVPSTYVSGRNIIFLSYAASYAESIGASAIFIGAHTEDYSGYPDCRKGFLESFNRAVNLGIADKRIKFHYPLIDKNKKEIIQLGLKMEVPFEFTWSCYKGKKLPCKQCDSCRFRINAFKELGLEDPLLKK
ncbi:MAG: 7-cyano-7-deazaguanine synthase QueC [Candidatus Omnitrophica bacterium]|nr:7-cyano-7-deazaguanine synthase QueC [Candidatus Omnitrophota bacterium]MCF7877476.1 7-cyano-7-deazaguanine synthase QueC [Candidatus Omnitrophota bacterium]MCF7878381.1 7-cyano-7-deazaguanine synthase QueC [Candidatus Omnitrophota bacterium]MCF7892839.1 7-cyano-7-deazaguanine synthase QueC [Candidatus Omnitrophota bacterium]